MNGTSQRIFLVLPFVRANFLIKLVPLCNPIQTTTIRNGDGAHFSSRISPLRYAFSYIIKKK